MMLLLRIRWTACGQARQSTPVTLPTYYCVKVPTAGPPGLTGETRGQGGGRVLSSTKNVRDLIRSGAQVARLMTDPHGHHTGHTGLITSSVPELRVPGVLRCCLLH